MVEKNILENIIKDISRSNIRQETGEKIDSLINITADEIKKDNKFLEWAIKTQGLAETYLLYILKGSQSHVRNKTIIEEWAKKRISSNKEYISLIREFFNFEDMVNIEKRIIGDGKIGGKATGMYIAFRTLKKMPNPKGFDIKIPESWFIGSEVFEDFIYRSGWDIYQHVKYFNESYVERYNEFCEKLPSGKFNEEIVKRVKKILVENHGDPLIIRSSSLLEDGFGTPFAGKYDSYFIPNTFSIDENLEMFFNGVKAIYASVFNPNSMEYRKKKDLLKEYESMAILVQKVVGKKYKQDNGKEIFMPLFSGVGFSQNSYPWSKDVKQEDGVVRLAMGLGTAVVDRSDSEDGKVRLADLSVFSSPGVEKDLSETQRKIHSIDINEKDYKKTVTKIRTYDLDFLKKLRGISDIMEVEIGNEYSRMLVKANEHTLERGTAFVTFPSIKNRWGRRFKRILKKIEFRYAAGRGHLREYLEKRKWVVVGNVIKMINNDCYMVKNDELKYYMKKIYNNLERDVFLEFNEENIKKFYCFDPEKGKKMIRRLHFVIGAQRLLNNISNYNSFRKALSLVINKKLRDGIHKILARNAVDTEFAVIYDKETKDGESDGTLYLLQCRPQAMYSISNMNKAIADIPKEKRFIDSIWPCPNAQVDGIEHIIFVDDKKYSNLSEKNKYALSSKIGELNKKYKNFIMILSGRAGSSQASLGVPVGYKDINNSKLLIEYQLEGKEPEFSYGSHFYLDLAGDNIFTFAIEKDSLFKRELLYNNVLEKYFNDALIVSKLKLNVYLSGIEKRIVCEII